MFCVWIIIFPLFPVCFGCPTSTPPPGPRFGLYTFDVLLRRNCVSHLQIILNSCLWTVSQSTPAERNNQKLCLVTPSARMQIQSVTNTINSQGNTDLYSYRFVNNCPTNTWTREPELFSIIKQIDKTVLGQQTWNKVDPFHSDSGPLTSSKLCSQRF